MGCPLDARLGDSPAVPRSSRFHVEASSSEALNPQNASDGCESPLHGSLLPLVRESVYVGVKQKHSKSFGIKALFKCSHLAFTLMTG